MTSPQQAGRDFERTTADRLGTEPQKGSGNQWYAKLDIRDRVIIWSLKHTGRRTLTITKEMLQEVKAAISGTFGLGPTAIGGMIVDIDGEPYTLLHLEDQLRLLESDVKYVPSGKGRAKRKIADVPEVLREEAE